MTRVLVVDDDPAWVAIVEAALAPAKVVHAHCGDAALAMIDDDGADYSVALVDVRMPGSWREIRRTLRDLGVPVFVVTSSVPPTGELQRIARLKTLDTLAAVESEVRARAYPDRR